MLPATVPGCGVAGSTELGVDVVLVAIIELKIVTVLMVVVELGDVPIVVVSLVTRLGIDIPELGVDVPLVVIKGLGMDTLLVVMVVVVVLTVGSSGAKLLAIPLVIINWTCDLTSLN